MSFRHSRNGWWHTLAAEKLTNLNVVQKLLSQSGVRPAKRFGQNFLVDDHVVSEICERVQTKNPDVVVEIGPGLGALTEAIVDIAPAVVAVEIDKRLAAGLAKRFAGHGNLEVRNCDILTFDFQKEFKDQSVLVLGSLPYRITTSILKHLIKKRTVISAACLITQLEVAEKITHSPGRDGSALGVFVNSFADVSSVRVIRKGSFFPVPEVESQYWEMSFLPSPRFHADEGVFFTLVRTLYRNRRKMTRRALQDVLAADAIAEVLEAAEIDGTVRGETLSFDQLDRLAQVSRAWLSASSIDDE